MRTSNGRPAEAEAAGRTWVSLEGARHAAAWSGIDAFNGCGFDLVWASGRTWSLLCDDPFSRKSWVDALNLAIRSTANTTGDIDAIASGAGQRNVPARGPQRGRTSSTTATRRRHPPDVVRPHSPPAAGEQSSRFPRYSSVRPSAQNTGHPSPQSRGTRGSHRYGDRWSCEDRTPPGDGAVVGALVHDAIAPTEGERHNHQRRKGASRTAEQHDEAYPSDVSGPAEKGVFSPSLTCDGAGARGSDEGSGGGGTVGSMDSSGGGRGRGRSIATERSEELARASAATWEHFQQLLERSRESKARFDKAMDGTAAGVASSATTSSGSLSASAVSAPSSSSSQTGDRKAGAGVGVAGRKTRAGVPPVDLATARQEATAEAATAAAAAAARTVRDDSLRQKPPSAVVYPDGGDGGGGDGDSECERLRKELTALRATVSEEREQRRETANPVAAAKAAAAAERERDQEEAAAKAAAAAAAAATQSQAESRLEEALAKAAKAERERAEAVRQREELEKALAGEVGERRRVTNLLEARSRSESALRERLEATAAEGDLKARLASTRSQLEAVSLERDALAEELDQCISRLGDQAREVTSALRSKQQREIAEISSRLVCYPIPLAGSKVVRTQRLS
ncbi:expressed unknown protein [Ectocarpus siliculosus]|uniref:PH domain-containing protein n=1 Tax=Ectocarpus siliculosus TaxID=2880 RepID=D8LEQ3_ECTSI|nr:expressed unknown protein [Ectocarpus siliculosus]|eukprot:CBN78616.1 expressed unknown protein [Ectocarpus siliculosus]